MKNIKIILLVLLVVLIIGIAVLWQISSGGKLLLPLIAVAAIVDSVNPCAFSVLLLTIAFLFSTGKSRSKILQIGLFYIAGIFLVYLGVGLGILKTLHLFNTPHFMAKIGALLLILLGGISIINDFFPSFPIKLKIPQISHRKMAELMEKGSAPTAFILGVLVGLFEFPCTGGPYLVVLGLLHDQSTYLKGLGYLIFYNLIFILPLFIILLIAGNKTLLDKVQMWKKSETSKMRLWGGIAAIFLGVIILLI